MVMENHPAARLNPNRMRLRANMTRLYRLLLLAAAVWLIRSHAPQQAAVELTPDRIKDFYPAAAEISAPDAAGVQTVKDSSGIKLGYLAQTSPGADHIIGYSGPTNTLLALDPNGRVLGLRILHSDDTPEHLAEVVSHRPFFTQFKGWKMGDVNNVKPPDAVSGATLTSNAIAEGILHRLGSPTTSLRFPQAITLAEVQSVMPEAAELKGDQIYNKEKHIIGCAIRTSPVSDTTVGYKGPSDTLLILDPAGANVLHVRLRSSFDTEAYVGYVTGDAHFLKLFANMPVQKLASLDYAKEGIEGVSGATETSYAVAEGLKKRAQSHLTSIKPWWQRLAESIRWRWQDTGHLLVLLSALVMAFTSLRGKPWARHLHHALLVIYGGFIAGEMLSQSLFVGWARGTAPWRSAPGLVLLAAVAVLAPVFTRRQLYCHHICPHGALQQLLARRLPWQWSPSPKTLRVLKALPFVLLGAIVIIAVIGLRVNLNALEPFDAYVFRIAGTGTLIVFAVGLIASLFLPLAYCHHGCPTGALFHLLRHTGNSDKLSPRDYIATALIAMLALTGCSPATPSDTHSVSGSAMGSTWSVSFRQSIPPNAQHVVAAELERLESIFSHYRPDSAISRFNRSTSTSPIAVPQELVTLVQRLQSLSNQAHGALDPTLAPIIDLWGFGSLGPRHARPSAETLQLALSHTGWSKLHVTVDPPAISKDDPALQLNLSCIVEGYALQKVDRLLTDLGSSSHLINVSGEIFGRGTGWNVGIQVPSPSAPQRYVTTQLPLVDAGLATSGTYRQLFAEQAQTYSHIIDPRTASPVTHALRSVTVVHPDAVVADTMATALLVLGPDEGRKTASALGLNAIFLLKSADPS